MPVPEQLQRQQAFSDEYDRKVGEQQTPPTEDPKPNEDPKPGNEQDSTAPQPAPAPAPAPAPVHDEVGLWKQRFLSLQGMFNTQMPKLQTQLKELTAELEKTKEELAAAKKPPSQPTKGASLVTENDVQAFGGDLIDMVKRAAQDQVAAVEAKYEGVIDTLRAELAAAKEGVGEVAKANQEVAQESFFTKLDARIPKWEEIQATQEAQTFLAMRVPGTSNTWNDVMHGAASQRDVDAVVEVFDTLFARYPQLNPRQPSPAQPSKQREQARNELERQVAPPKNRAAGPTPPAGKRVYSEKEYHDESMKVVRLVQQNKEREANALEAELNAALAEGRIRPN